LTNQIFTIGHSNHTTEKFLALLRLHGITAIADVRSSPRTRVNPDFSQPFIEKVLSEAGIRYLFLGEELGARSPDESCYEKGIVRYDRLAKQSLFQNGLDRVEMDSEKDTLALLCAEKEPLQCHRCILVSRHLVDRKLPVSHILADGTTETHQETILRLKHSLNLVAQRDMFQTDDDLINMAYSLQEEKIAYALPEDHIPDLVA
jgi:uncharacterized protein (DUF488 family)